MVTKKTHKADKADKHISPVLQSKSLAAPVPERAQQPQPPITASRDPKKDKKLHAVAIRKSTLPLLEAIKNRMISNMQSTSDVAAAHVSLRTIDVVESCLRLMAEKLGVAA